MKEVMKMPDIASRWDSPEVAARILELLDDPSVGRPVPE